jgi:NAD(P)-dependent dehydrogenase (short-subunit alcohol dehydrogenase family)
MAGLMEGKVGLITGAATGIGRAAALLFAAEGARVVVADVDEKEARSTVASIGSAGGDAAFFRVDVSDESQVISLVEHTVDRFGRLDYAVNNAGIAGPTAALHQVELADWSRTIATNLGGVFLSMKHEIIQMQRQGFGAIVNTASGAGIVATPGMAPYCASKHGILGLTKTAAVENAALGIRVNAICPGATDTPMMQATMAIDPSVKKMILKSMPGGRMGEPAEIAEAALWLCSDRASFVSGEAMLVDGGTVAR